MGAGGHGSHVVSRRSSDSTSENHLTRRSRDHGHHGRNSHEADVDVEAQVAAAANQTDGPHHVRILDNPEHHTRSGESPNGTFRLHRSDTAMSKSTVKSLRRRGRADTIIYGATEMGRTSGWAPGQEPGIDTSDPAPPYTPGLPGNSDSVHYDQLHQRCEITVVDFSSDAIETVDLDNENLEDFLNQEPRDWSEVRWINVNGLSWDVIRLLGNHKGLHRLAIEDLMHTKSRTKADWYQDHTYMVLPLQKLINLGDHDSDRDDDASDYGSDSGSEGGGGDGDSQYRTRIITERQRRKREQKRRGAVASLWHDFWKPNKTKKSAPVKATTDHSNRLAPSNSFRNSNKVDVPWAPKNIRSMQRYHSGPNMDRVEYVSSSISIL